MKLGSLCTGYGGLDLAVESLLGARTVWLSEIDKNAAKVCEARFPGAPNLGDLTKIDWEWIARTHPVDVLTAGYPCQPFSHAGKRQGTNDDRHIWPHILDALRVLRPRLAVFENVAGHLSLGFDTVLGDLASIGFDAEWVVVRASDVGACHQRKRLFILAADPDDRGRLGRWSAEPATSGRGRKGRVWGTARAGQDAPADASNVGHERGGGARGRWDGPADLGGEAPADADIGRCEVRSGREHAGSELRTGADERRPVDWGDYGPAIARHARLVGRDAPAPTDDRGRLSARFTEWMMCLPDGWVTDILPRNPALKALGNGVVPPQAAYAIAHLLERSAQAEAAA